MTPSTNNNGFEINQKKYACDLCDYKTCKKGNFEAHLLTRKHSILKEIHEKGKNGQPIKKQPTFECKVCNYICYTQYKIDRHLSTPKHEKKEKGQKGAAQKTYPCPCGKTYKHASSLTKHSYTCNREPPPAPASSGVITEELVLNLLKDNQEFKELLIQEKNNFKEFVNEQKQTNQHLIALASAEKTTIINNNNTTQNNTQNNNMVFNLNHFLNEKCKDAINMTDFIESMKVSFEDLENTGKNGLVKSLSQCITRELGKLDVYSRPIHCSDSGRKVLHIKNENEWQRDTDEHISTKKLLSKINHTMNLSQILKWKDTYPSCELSNDKRNALFLKIVRNMVDDEDGNYEKIIKNISDKIVIDKGAQKNMMLTN
jgi:hypothetical protein